MSGRLMPHRPGTLTLGFAGARTPSSPGARAGLGSRRWTVAASPRGTLEVVGRPLRTTAAGRGPTPRPAGASLCPPWAPAFALPGGQPLPSTCGHCSGVFLGLSLVEGWLWDRSRRGHLAVLLRAGASPGGRGEDERRTPVFPALGDDCGRSPQPWSLSPSGPGVPRAW